MSKGRGRNMRGMQGMGGGGMNPQAMLKQAQKMQQQMQEIQDQAELETVTTTSGGGMVEVEVSGGLQIKRLTIDPEAVDPEDVEMLQDMVIAAVNQGISDAQAMVQEKMAPVTGGMGIPGLF